MYKNKIWNKYFFVWVFLCFAYLLLIGYLTWLFPYSGDELFSLATTLKDHLKYFIFNSYMALRIGCFVGAIILHAGKVFFILLNPPLQLFIIFSAFYFIYMRFPRFDSYKDFPSFLLMLVLGTLFITQPSDILIWFGGATNYAWVFIAFIWFLIYLRKLDEGKQITGKYLPFLFILWGIFLGMMNENNSPMVLCLMIAFTVYAYFKKIVLHKDFWFLMFGVIAGLFVLFKLSGNDVRLQTISFGFIQRHTIWEKLLMHLSHIHSFASANLCLIYLLPLFLFLLFLDKKKEIIKDKKFYLSILCWGVSFGLAIVLCAAPRIALRAFYSASWFCIFSLVFFLIEIENLYKIKLIKYFAFLFLLIFFYIMPFFILGVSVINNMVEYRQNILDTAKIKGRKQIYLFPCMYNNDLPENWQITYWDALFNTTLWNQIEKIKIYSDLGENVHMF